MLGSITFGGRGIRPVSGTVGAARRPAHVALVGSDYPDLRPTLRVAEGDRVSAGQVLFTDRRHPEIAFAAPAGGMVEAITLGAGRTLSALVIRLDAQPGPRPAADPVALDSATDARATLLARGLWPAFRSRPFGRIPGPHERPLAIFVNAMPDRDGAPDPRSLLATRQPDFDRGLDVIALLTEGPVFVCQTRGADHATPGRRRIRTEHFPGDARAGLSAHHILRLGPPREGQTVWTIGWQDVAAIGELAATGRYPGERVIAFHDAQAGAPLLFPTLLGANLHDLASGGHRHSEGGTFRLISGAAVGGREALWLGRYDTQAALVRMRQPSPFTRLAGLLAKTGSPRPAPILPMAALDAALPFATPAVPLMRALATGDVETAERLGCRHLVEEDMARLSHLCTSGSDYGRLLRRVLDEMEAAS